MNTVWGSTKAREIRLPQGDVSKEATATIASLSDQDWYVSRTYGVFHIPACPKGERCSVLLVTARGDALDLGDNRRFPFTISARDIAEDLVQDLGVHGVFVCAGARPSDDEIAAATARRDAWYQQLVVDADQMWARGHSYREISDMHRRAAISLNMEREWAYIPQRMVDCPACGEKVKPGVAICRHCGAVLDAEKAAKHGLGTQPIPPGSPAPARPGGPVAGGDPKKEEPRSPRDRVHPEGKGTK